MLIQEISDCEKVGKSFFYNAIKYLCHCAETVLAGAAEKVIYLLVFHPIITFLADRLWNNKRIFLHMQKHQYDAKNLSFIPIY